MKAAVIENRVYRGDAHAFDRVDADGGSWRMVALILLVSVGTALGFVWLRSSTETLQAEVANLSEECAIAEKEISNLRITYEEYTSRGRILEGVARFGLDLGPPSPGQIRRIDVPGGAEVSDRVALRHVWE